MGQFDTPPVKKLAVLGSTGSIGQQTLDIVRAFPQYFQIVGLSAWQNRVLLKQQADEFHPLYVNYLNKQDFSIDGNFIELEDMASLPEVDIVLNAISGTDGMCPTLTAIKAGKSIALANKESIVMAGEVIMAMAKKSGARILPVDSEPSAVWQCLRGEDKFIKRLILTASGGPFLHLPQDKLPEVTVEQALHHPSWNMGKKITIDSATLLNKGLEVIEAHWLFNMAVDDISILIHPQSIIHSMVEFIDGTIKAQISKPDMRFPILYALSYPERLSSGKLPVMDWKILNKLTFEIPDLELYPCLKLALESARKGGTYPAALCGADEAAVDLFLQNRIKFTDISKLLEKTLAKHNNVPQPSLDDISSACNRAKEELVRLVGN
jgi:1-deoxy-D-xylulose-5-phosphate reductoisomerase